MFTRNELLFIKDSMAGIINVAMNAASRMCQKGFTYPNGEKPTKAQIDAIFDDSLSATIIHKKIEQRLSRLTWPATAYCLPKNQ